MNTNVIESSEAFSPPVSKFSELYMKADSIFLM